MSKNHGDREIFLVDRLQVKGENGVYPFEAYVTCREGQWRAFLLLDGDFAGQYNKATSREQAEAEALKLMKKFREELPANFEVVKYD
jgi:hypothetical protein